MIPRYALDYVILSIPHLHEEFSYRPNLDLYGPLRPRVVVRGDTLEVVPLSHLEQRDSAEAYHRWLRPWRYWRYDRSVPAIFSLLPPRFRPDRNPFYYRSDDAKDETRELLSTMLTSLADSGAVVLLHTQLNSLTRIARGISPRVYAWTSQVEPGQLPFLYLAPNGHLSALGNELRAREIADLLTGKTAPDLTLWEPRLRREALTELVGIGGGAIARGKLAFEGLPVGGFKVREARNSGFPGWRPLFFRIRGPQPRRRADLDGKRRERTASYALPPRTAPPSEPTRFPPFLHCL